MCLQVPLIVLVLSLIMSSNEKESKEFINIHSDREMLVSLAKENLTSISKRSETRWRFSDDSA